MWAHVLTGISPSISFIPTFGSGLVAGNQYSYRSKREFKVVEQECCIPDYRYYSNLESLYLTNGALRSPPGGGGMARLGKSRFIKVRVTKNYSYGNWFPVHHPSSLAMPPRRWLCAAVLVISTLPKQYKVRRAQTRAVEEYRYVANYYRISLRAVPECSS